MSDHEFENYLTLIGRLLRLSPAQREAIGEELRDHFESRLAELVEAGLAHDEAVRIALEEFGDAAGLAASFTSISQTRRRRLIMRCTVGSIAAIAAAVVVAMAVWPENHAGRVVAKANGQVTKATGPAESIPPTIDSLTAETESRLNELTSVEFVETPLTEVLAFLADKHHIQFFMNKVSLRDAAIDLSAIPVSINLKNVRLKTLLGWILTETNLAFVVREGVVVIATRDCLNVQVETRVYDCREILSTDAALAVAIEPKSSVIGQPVTPAKTSSSTSEYQLIAQVGHPASLPETATPTNSSAANRLTSLIQSTVAKDTWHDVGGPGSIVEYQGLLIVSQTAEVQAEVKDLLDEIAARLHAKPK